MDDVLGVVGLSRQTIRVVLEGSGEFVVKAGRVLRAEAPPKRGRPAFVDMYRKPGRGFALWQHGEAAGEPIGLLTDLIAEAKRLEESPAATSRQPLLAGSFADHRLDEVLDVLGITRQLIELRVVREDESRVTMILKAGQVLACEDDRHSTSGVDGFRTLFADHGMRFEVVRLPAARDGFGKPVGDLSALVQQARKQDVHGKKPPGVLFQGTFQDFPLSDVLEGLSVTRLTVEMVFHDDLGMRGTVVLKAGQVLAAQALRSGSSHREAFLELMADPGESFMVVRRSGTPASRPIGDLRQLLLDARARTEPAPPPRPPIAGLRAATVSAAPPPPVRTVTPAHPTAAARPSRTPPTIKPTVVPPPNAPVASKPRVPVTPARVPGKAVAPAVRSVPAAATPATKAASSRVEVVLDGTFDDFTIQEVLHVLSMSRQYIALGTLRHGVPLGRMVVKSGRLLLASYGSVRQPVQAMTMLLEEPGNEFRVRRLPHYADKDLGSLAEILEQAQRAKSPATVIPLPRSAPAPTPVPELEVITRSLAAIEARLHAPIEAPPRDDTALVAAFHGITQHLEILSRSMEAMHARVEIKIDEANEIASKRTRSLVTLFGVALVIFAVANVALSVLLFLRTA